MIVNLFSTAGSNQPKTAGDHYREALRSLIAGREQETGTHLNHCRDALLAQRHCTDFCDEDVQTLFPDLTVEKFQALYGDYGSTCRSPWVRQPELLTMIGMHLAQVGTPQDVAAYHHHIEANRDYFPHVPALQLIIGQ